MTTDAREIDRYAADLLAPNKGYVVVRHTVHPNIIDAYREECRRFLRTGKLIHKRMNRRDLPDYIHPRTVLPDGTDVFSWQPSTLRIYQFLHNRHSKEAVRIFAALMSLRDRIEECWLHDALYKEQKQRLYDYVQVTRFVERRGGLPKHRDHSGSPTCPFLQSFMLLSQPPVDYRGGEFTIYSANDTPVRLQADLNVGKGDLVLFDRSLCHEVEPTDVADGNGAGRWSVVLARDGTVGKYWDRIRYSDFRLRHAETARAAVRRMAGRLLGGPR